mgnify:CR=1 FL=1
MFIFGCLISWLVLTLCAIIIAFTETIEALNELVENTTEEDNEGYLSIDIPKVFIDGIFNGFIAYLPLLGLFLTLNWLI